MPAVALVALAPWLRGLRAAGKIRTTARRVGTAAAAAATGLAAFSAAPYVVPAKPAHPTPAMTPALGVTAVSQTHPHARLVAVTRPTVHTTARPATTAAAPATPAHTVIPHLPRSCHNATGATIGCATHRAHMLYVRTPVPVAGQRWIGVSTDEVDCSSLPSTPLIQCDTDGGNS